MMEWISVKDRLPEYDVPVLVISKTYPNEVTTAVLRYEDGWHWEQYAGYGFLSDKDCYEFDDDYQYTHWMPLPTPPKEDE